MEKITAREMKAEKTKLLTKISNLLNDVAKIMEAMDEDDSRYELLGNVYNDLDSARDQLREV